MKNIVTMIWKVYGCNGENQGVSYHPSSFYDFGSVSDVRLIDVINCDLTKTNEYTIVRISRNSEEECWSELEGQLSDGIFENHSYGEVELVGMSDSNCDLRACVRK